MICVVNEMSFANTNDHNTKNKLIKKVNTTNTMWKDLSDISGKSKSLEWQTEIKSVEVDRISTCAQNQCDHESKEYKRSEENPVNGLFFVI